MRGGVSSKRTVARFTGLCLHMKPNPPLHPQTAGTDWVAAQVQDLSLCREAMWEAVHSTGPMEQPAGAFYYFAALPPQWRPHEVCPVTPPPRLLTEGSVCAGRKHGASFACINDHNNEIVTVLPHCSNGHDPRSTLQDAALDVLAEKYKVLVTPGTRFPR